MSFMPLVLTYAVTPVHVGTGRSPGIVDLPFQRDSIGYPIVYGSSFKGVLKSLLINKDSKEFANKDSEEFAKCVFGAEPEDPDKYMGRFIVTDLIPVFYPIASLLDGYVYVSTDYLIKKAEDILSVVGGGTNNNIYKKNEGEEVNILLLGKLKSSYTLTLTETVKETVKGIGSLIKDKVYVFDNDIGLQIVESSLIRVTRNVLDDNKKTSQNLWTEEYLPQGTVFIGGIIDAKRTNKSCEDVGDVDNIFRQNLD
ncbi:MAG: type III-B CRISPR module RAMP protein Cmr4, partial [Caldisphaera sp.]